MKQRKLLTNKLLSRYLFITLLMLLQSNIWAQTQGLTVTGTITSSEDGSPIPGATVQIKGTLTGTTSDFDGLYSIEAKTGDVLIFSFIGMENQNVTVTKAKLNVILVPQAESLEEVVVIGYGTVKKKELTGAVAQVKSADIDQYVTSDVASALQGQVAGVSVVSNSGEPGAQSSIQIRGITSLTSGANSPLWVVDGIPQVGNPGLNMNEIQTFDILKDAASTAVYGSRGAAGVILVTTKKGKEGVMKIDFTHTYGVQNLAESAPLMNASEQIAFETVKESLGFANHISILDANPTWYDNDNDFSQYVLNNNPTTTNYSLNVSGGSNKLTYNFSGGYLNTEGTLINSYLKRYNARTSTTYTTDNWKINTSIAVTLEKNEVSSNGLLAVASRYSPYFPLIDPDAEAIFTSDDGPVTTPLNNLAQAIKRENLFRRDILNGSLDITRRITDDLSFNTRVGVSVRNQLQKQFVPAYTLVNPDDFDDTETDPTKSFVNSEAQRLSKFSWDAGLNYNKKFGEHTIGLLAAVTLEEDTFEGFFGQKQGVSNNDINVLNTATINPTTNSLSGYNTTRVGTLGRVQYNYKGKYLFSVLGRYDGSSKFGPDNRWGFFPSASAAWNVSDENFWEPINHIVNNFKIRASYGEVGNDAIADYVFSSTIGQAADYIFSDNDGSFSNGTAVRDYANEVAKWETSKSINFGIDLGFLKNKFVLTAEYYNTKKEDMLFPITYPSSSGAFNQTGNAPFDNFDHRNVVLNVGNMTNQGIELGARYNQKIGESNLRLNATFSKNTNEITSIFNDIPSILNGNSVLVTGDNQNSLITVFATGYEAGAFFIYETNGVVQTDAQLADYQQLGGRESAQKGDLMYVDTNNDGQITAADKVYKGSGLPDFEIGFNMNWNYKNFDLAMNWYGSVGSEIMNGNKAVSYIAGRHPDLSNMWTENNSTSNIPNWSGAKGDINHNGNTDYWLENGDYLRLKLVTLGYSLPKNVLEKINISKFRLFVSAQNPITITNYDGYDPEIGGNVASRGLDVSRYPISSLYSLGVNIGF
ncbi:TonB-dependent receptor [Aureibaculum sp. A20]|uniref:TonB-dependent receptor n=1 Tax=Aureibaculum flavum TaxID=2795986 RepID=A0ABS0WP20_9FLAO|nr:TonB-dependent receptor [Aureibaculum flavum]MBJ2173613.1 TonB-dependent receptor [Aureibaculum flavum]